MKQLETSLLGRVLVMSMGVAIMLVAIPIHTFGQDAQALVTGKVESDFFVTPDFKFTEVDGRFANLAGLYGGWFINRKLLLGGGGYFLTNRSDDFKMTYGGFVAEYFIRPKKLVNFSVKGLIGGGTVTVSGLRGRFDDLDELPFDIPYNFRFRGRGADFPFPGFPNVPDFSFPIFEDVSESFFVAEPELNLNLNITETIRVGFGGGYRLIGGAGRISDRLDGFTANAALKLAF